MTIEKIDGSYILRVRECEQGDIFKPNINKTFTSVAKVLGGGQIPAKITQLI